MATAFPGGQDSFPRPDETTNTDDPGFLHDELHNDVSDAVEAIEAELGVNPAGSETTVSARIAAVETGKVGSATVDDLWRGTQAAYDALGTWPTTTIYFITGP